MASNQNGIHLSETFHLHYNLLHSELSENSELATINQRQTISLITVTLVTINLYQNISLNTVTSFSKARKFDFYYKC